MLGYSPLDSGLLQLPVAFIIMGVAPQVPKIVARVGVSWVVPTGLTLIAIGLAGFSTLEVDSSILNLYLGLVPLATGMALTMTPLTTLIMSSVPLGRAGVGSAMNDTTRELGGALGVAVLGSIVTSRYVADMASSISGLPADAQSAADSGLSGALKVAEQVGGDVGNALADTARQAFVNGLSTAALVGAIVVLSAAIAARLLLPRGLDTYSNAPDPVAARRTRRRASSSMPARSSRRRRPATGPRSRRATDSHRLCRTSGARPRPNSDATGRPADSRRWCRTRRTVPSELRRERVGARFSDGSRTSTDERGTPWRFDGWSPATMLTAEAGVRER